MGSINYFAVGSALDATIGPLSRVAHDISRYREATREMAELLARRRPHIEALHQPGSGQQKYIRSIRRAFEAVREGFSPDRVVADPRLNREFLSQCEAFGIDDVPFNLNWTLLNLRKSGQLVGLRSKKSVVHDQWRYAFASEMAATSIYYRQQVSVDRVICDPERVKEFDRLAKALAPGFSTFEYRWAALNIRKKGSSVGGQSKRRVGRLTWSDRLPFPHIQQVPHIKGIYTLHEDNTALYISNSEDLRESMGSQLRMIDVPLLEADLWHPDPQRLFWRYAELPEMPSNARSGMVNELIGTLKPVFNIPRAA
jgi:hypothetical protein